MTALRRLSKLALAFLAPALVAAVSGAQGPVTVAAASGSGQVTYQEWHRVDTVTFPTSAAAPNAATARAAARVREAVNRSLSRHPSAAAAANAAATATSPKPPVVKPIAVAPGSPGLISTWEGINAYTESRASGFTFTPPDQGLCTGNGYVFEIVNNAVQVYLANGTPASPVVSSNAFFGLPPTYNPTTNRWGPEPTDPTCTYDPAIGRWYVDEVVLDLNPKTGNLTLVNKATLAVSTSPNPLGSWYIYQTDLTDTNGGGMHVSCPCLGDFPKIAVDAYGLFLSTNEYPWSGPGFYGNGYNGAQLYASSKTELAAGRSEVTIEHFNNTALTAPDGRTVPGFTVWPATVPGTSYDTRQGGTEFFASSAAAMEANPKSFTGYSRLIGVYQLTDTSSLDTSHPHARLQGALLRSELYGEAPWAMQKLGPVPLRDCLAVECFPGLGPSNEVEGGLDPSDTRPLTVWYAGGELDMALDTVMQVAGNIEAGPAWFVIQPSTQPTTATILNQGYVGVAGNNVIYPSIATAPNGTGIMDFAIAGRGYYPSQGYLDWGLAGPTSVGWLTHAGAAPLDDFCEYLYFDCAGTSPPAIRPRYGDYSWATYMNGVVYVADEMVNSSCTFAEYKKDPTCGGTRSLYSNWSTRISAITP